MEGNYISWQEFYESLQMCKIVLTSFLVEYFRRFILFQYIINKYKYVQLGWQYSDFGMSVSLASDLLIDAIIIIIVYWFPSIDLITWILNSPFISLFPHHNVSSLYVSGMIFFLSTNIRSQLVNVIWWYHLWSSFHHFSKNRGSLEDIHSIP